MPILKEWREMIQKEKELRILRKAYLLKLKSILDIKLKNNEPYLIDKILCYLFFECVVCKDKFCKSEITKCNDCGNCLCSKCGDCGYDCDKPYCQACEIYHLF